MNKTILGIDLGTSSVKLMLRTADGSFIKAKASYAEKTTDGWRGAVKKAFADLPPMRIDAIGLTSQVGTYIVNGSEVIGWEAGVGRAESERMKVKYPQKVFIEEIAMPHPSIDSYPIPRLLYIKNHYETVRSVCQPKDWLCAELTGRMVTDRYSWRGLAHTKTGAYSALFLKEIGLSETVLPPIAAHDEIIGTTTAECEVAFGIPQGIPVVGGMNDFFSSLVGMGMGKNGELFDVTGTSEHLGVLQDEICAETNMVSGVYFDRFIHYGGTASAGASMDFGIRNFGLEGIDIGEILKKHPPIFAPYVNGERAPIFDSNARGVFFGIGADCGKRELAYAVLEGVVFSLYHIYENLGCPPCDRMVVSGGAAKDAVLNRMKAAMFRTRVCVPEETDTTALGAVMTAAKAIGATEGEIQNRVVRSFEPDDACGKIFAERYEIYKNIYPSLKREFAQFSKIREEMIK